MKTVGLVLSGCGVFDGAEIHESVLCMLALRRAGVAVQCIAPDQPQHHVINHITGEEMPENRNVMIEAARIARGDITDLKAANAEELDGLILPGGFGAAKNLSDFAIAGAECQVNRDLQALVQAIHKAGKPLGFVCISPVLIPRLVGEGVKMTIGNDADTAKAAEAMGAHHEDCGVESIVTDPHNKVVSTPAYMLAGDILEAEAGINKLVAEVLSLIE